MERKVSETVGKDDDDESLEDLWDKVDIIAHNLDIWQRGINGILDAQKITIDNLFKTMKATMKRSDAQAVLIKLLIKNQKRILKMVEK